MGFEQIGLCTAVGFQALANATGGAANTGFGYRTLFNNTSGAVNTAIGFSALAAKTTGNGNTATGASALFSNTTGEANTANGYNALKNSTIGSGNTALGNFAGFGVTTADSVICIGADGQNVSNSCYIGQIWNQPGGSQAVYVNSDGKLGQMVSSKRFKDEIKPMEQASEVIYGLKPVSFRYKAEIEPTRPQSFGLIAEEVEKVSADLVTRGADGKVNSVRYDAVNAMLLNEFLKEHCKVQEQEATIAQMKKRMDALVAHIKEQDSKIQRVSDRVEMSKAAAQVAAIR